MKTVTMKYGSGKVDVCTDEKSLLGIIQSKGISDKKSEEQCIKEALENPIGSERLSVLAQKAETVCIVISDITRAWQKQGVYLPYIVDELRQAGIADEHITFLCATGSHRSQSKAEHEVLLGEKLAGRFTVIDHDCRDAASLINLGTTSYGTPIEINKLALEKDLLVLTGAVVYHDLAGWGGGKKSILPGISSYESIMANHKLSLNSQEGAGANSSVRCGNVLDNPVHLDMLEAAAAVKPAFLFNVIMDEKGSIGKAVAGDYVKAHEAGQRIVAEADGLYINELADMVVTSAGGYPKDIDLYQSSKALINAKEAVKKGGTIVLLAECMEGFGGMEVQQMLEEYEDMGSREKALRESFSIAKYTGYMIAEIAANYHVILVSSLGQKNLEKANIKAASTLEKALSLAKQISGTDIKLYLMPQGASTLPSLV